MITDGSDAGGLGSALQLVNQLTGSASNEARVMLLERRLTGQSLDPHLPTSLSVRNGGASALNASAPTTFHSANATWSPQLQSVPEQQGSKRRRTHEDGLLPSDPAAVVGPLDSAVAAALSRPLTRLAANEREGRSAGMPEQGRQDAEEGSPEDALPPRARRGSSPQTGDALAPPPAAAAQAQVAKQARQTPRRKNSSPVRKALFENGGRSAPRSAAKGTSAPARDPSPVPSAFKRNQKQIHSYFPTMASDANSRDSLQVSGGAAASSDERLVGTTAAAAAAAAASAAMAGVAASAAAAPAGGTGATVVASSGAGSAVAPTERLSHLYNQLEEQQRRQQALEERCRLAESQAEASCSSLVTLQRDLAAALTRAAAAEDDALALQQQLRDARREASERDASTRVELCRLVRAAARSERELGKTHLSNSAARLGTLGVHRTLGMQIQEFWEDGQAFHHLSQRQAALTQQKEDVELARKALRKKLAPPPTAKALAAAAAAAAANNAGGDASTSGRCAVGLAVGGEAAAADGEFMSSHEFVACDEILKVRIAALKREEEALKQEGDRLEQEKVRHLRLLKRTRDEDSSRFNTFCTLGKRYVLQNLLGKGGFSEVYKAYDLGSQCTVAVKIHQLNSQWNEAKKQSYVKHAMREYDIHRVLQHAHVVSLIDVLEIDNNTFATVLEYCDGQDLEALLKDHSTLPEKEARSIIGQVFSGLAYLNQGRRIIHYDLKPANILFDSIGRAKITDFGLSKIVDEGQTMGMELTSQGAGTYWYLPPECFETGPNAPKISSKVDVWAAGVIFFQMLYGRRPFGEGCSQETLLRERIMLNARDVEFPAKPTVSAEAKDFIRRCLAPRQDSRPDVLTLVTDAYLQLKKAGAHKE